MNIPILRLELEGIKKTLLTALWKHNCEIEHLVSQAVKEYCTEENLYDLIQNQARQVIASTIETEITNFYAYGKGRKVIQEAVKQTLENENVYD